MSPHGEQRWVLRRALPDTRTHIYWTGEFRRSVPVVSTRPDRAVGFAELQMAIGAREADHTALLIAFQPLALSLQTWSGLRVWSAFDAIGSKAIAALSQPDAAARVQIPLHRFRRDWLVCKDAEMVGPALEQPFAVVRRGMFLAA